jgi:hypothetical protein
LVGWICRNYGTQRNFAERIGVTPHTVTNYVRRQPELITRHVAKFVRDGRRDQLQQLYVAIEDQRRYIDGTSNGGQ